MIRIFPRRCVWLFVYKDLLLSICGSPSYLYMHNLRALHGIAFNEGEEEGGTFEHSGGIRCTTKILSTLGVMRCCVAEDPRGRGTFVYAGRPEGVLVMKYHPPRESFLVYNDIPCTLSTTLPLFEPIVREEGERIFICTRATVGEDGTQVLMDLIDIDNEFLLESTSGKNGTTVTSFCQIQRNFVLVAIGRTIQITDSDGHFVKPSLDLITRFDFKSDISNFVCLPGSVLCCYSDGVEGRRFKDGSSTMELEDKSRVHRVLSRDRVVVMERRRNVLSPDGVRDISSRIYVLANELV